MIKIDVVSNEGHTEFAIEDKTEAVEKIKELAKSGNKWVYVGSNNINPADLTPGMLSDNEEVTLTNPLVGG